MTTVNKLLGYLFVSLHILAFVILFLLVLPGCATLFGWQYDPYSGTKLPSTDTGGIFDFLTAILSVVNPELAAVIMAATASAVAIKKANNVRKSQINEPSRAQGQVDTLKEEVRKISERLN